MVHIIRVLIYCFLIPASLAGCGGGNSDSASSGGMELPVDVAPITDGAWYRPALFVTWQWQLQGAINSSYGVEIYDVDLFDTTVSSIDALQAEGKKVICYFSAGSYEGFRADKDEFYPADLGKTLDGWEEERWLDIRSGNVHSIMKSRLDLASSKGCDGVEPDNVDGYNNNTGFSLTANDQLAYNRFIANEAHSRGLSVGLKNDTDQVAGLVDYYDFTVNEQCFEYSECDTLIPFIVSGKPVLNVEYLEVYVTDSVARATLCSDSVNMQFSTLVLPLDLDDSFRLGCF